MLRKGEVWLNRATSGSVARQAGETGGVGLLSSDGRYILEIDAYIWNLYIRCDFSPLVIVNTDRPNSANFTEQVSGVGLTGQTRRLCGKNNDKEEEEEDMISRLASSLAS